LDQAVPSPFDTVGWVTGEQTAGRKLAPAVFKDYALGDLRGTRHNLE